MLSSEEHDELAPDARQGQRPLDTIAARPSTFEPSDFTPPVAFRVVPDGDGTPPPTPPGPIDDDLAAPAWLMWASTVMLVAAVVVAADVLLAVWPDDPPVKAAAPVKILWQRATVQLSGNDRLMLVAMLTGVIGSLIHVMTSFADFAGNRRLARSWLPWYALRPVIGMGLALFFYLVMRAGLLSAQTSPGEINPFGVAAVSGLAGMFSKQATDKLSETFSVLFKPGPGKGDDQRAEALGKNAPTRPQPVTGERRPTGERRDMGGGFRL